MLGVQDKLTVCLTNAVPAPDSAMVWGEFKALLEILTVPVTLPVAAGVNVTDIVAAFPGARIRPVGRPVALNPGPETLTFEIETLAFPMLVKVTGLLPLVGTGTLPKLNAVELAASARAGALTVSVAGALIELPARLRSVTLNFAPLSEVISPGVV